MTSINEFSYDELLELLSAYDEYIQDANDDDRYHSDWRPVCVREFLNNEFQYDEEDEYE